MDMGFSVRSVLALCATFACGVSPAFSAPVRYYSSGDGLPFSEAVQVGDMLFLAGQIGVAPGAKSLVPGGIEAEARQAMENIGGILKRRGLTFDAVVKCTVMLSDIKDWPTFNTVYVGYFKPDRMPARSAFATAGLAYNGKVEVECWAHSPAKQR
jgi:2-iminobutanoate/2-iminopropanoate deaminase